MQMNKRTNEICKIINVTKSRKSNEPDIYIYENFEHKINKRMTDWGSTDAKAGNKDRPPVTRRCGEMKFTERLDLTQKQEAGVSK